MSLFPYQGSLLRTCRKPPLFSSFPLLSGHLAVSLFLPTHGPWSPNLTGTVRTVPFPSLLCSSSPLFSSETTFTRSEATYRGGKTAQEPPDLSGLSRTVFSAHFRTLPPLFSSFLQWIPGYRTTRRAKPDLWPPRGGPLRRRQIPARPRESGGASFMGSREPSLTVLNGSGRREGPRGRGPSAGHQ